MADLPRQTDPKHEQPARPADRRTRAGAAYDVQTAPGAPENGRRTELRPGDQFGRYRIERLLGEGAMGAVYLAQDETLHRHVALKIPTFPASDTDGRIRFVREARSAAALHHANICQIHDVGEIDGTQYLTMAFIDGQPLTRVVASEKRLSMRQIALFIRKLALALQEAHTAGIIHRDLKPANIMVDRKGDPVVMDFGLARSFHGNATGRITQSGALVGSPAYMSPEQALGKLDQLGPASDIYSLGVILYELITGKLPFDGTLFQILNGVINDPPPPMRPLRTDVDADLEAICLRMMAKKPADRFGSMKDVADALKAALGTMGSKKPGETPSRSARETMPPVATRTLGATAGQDEPDYWNQPLAEAPLPRARVRDGKSPPVAARTSFRDRIPGGDRWFMAIAISSGVVIGMVTLGIVIWISITRRGDPSDPTAPDPAGTVATTTGDGSGTSPMDQPATPDLAVSKKADRNNVASRSTGSLGPVVGDVAGNNTAGSAEETATDAPGPFEPTRVDPQLPPLNLTTLAPELVADAWQTPVGCPPPAVVPFDIMESHDHQVRWSAFLKLPVEAPNSVGITMVLIPPGEFVRHLSPPEGESPESLLSTTTVRLTAPLYFGATEVTWEQFRQFADTTSYKTHAERPDSPGGELVGITDAPKGTKFYWRVPHPASVDPRHPVGHIHPDDARAFCVWLSKKENAKYRLPTEAEWEFALRAGRASISSTDLRQETWGLRDGEELKVPLQNSPMHVVGSKRANPLGLFDMIGNQREWCDDKAAQIFDNSVEIDPRGSSGSLCRGSSWAEVVGRSYLRRLDPKLDLTCGFRVVREVDRIPSLKASAKTRYVPASSPVRIGEPLSPHAVVTRPARLPGVSSWSIEMTCTPGLTALPSSDGRWIALQAPNATRIYDSELRLTSIIPSTGFAANWCTDHETLAVKRHSNRSWSIDLWHIPTGRIVRSIPTSPSSELMIAISPNRRNIAVLSNHQSGRLSLRSIFIYDVEDPRRPPLRVLLADAKKGNGEPAEPATNLFPSGVQCLVWSADGRRLMIVGAPHRIDFKSPFALHVATIDAEALTIGPPRDVLKGLNCSDVKISPDESRLLIGTAKPGTNNGPSESEVKVLNLWDGQIEWTSTNSLPSYPSDEGWLSERRFAYRIARGIGTSSADAIDFNSVELTTGKSAEFTLTSREWQLIRKAWSSSRSRQHVLGTRPYMVESSHHRFQLELCPTSTGQQVLRTSPEYGNIEYTDRLVWSPSGDRFAAFTYNFSSTHDSLSVWRTRDGEQIHRSEIAKRKEQFEISKNQFWSREKSFEWKPNALFILGHRQVDLFDMTSFTTTNSYAIDSLEEKGWLLCAVSPDGAKIAFVPVANSARVLLIDAMSGKKQTELSHQAAINKIAWASSSAKIATATRNRITIWNAEDGQIRNVITRLPDSVKIHEVLDLTWEPDDTKLRVRFFGSDWFSVSLKDEVWSEQPSIARREVDALHPSGQFALRHIGSGVYASVDPISGQQSSVLVPAIAIPEPDDASDASTATVPSQKRVTSDWILISPTGHYRSTPNVEKMIRYVVVRDDRTVTTYTPAEFTAKFGWKNDSAQAKLWDSDIGENPMPQ